MNMRNPLNVVALVLVIVGALNWLLVGLFDFNLVAELFGMDSALSKLIYILIGLAGLYLIYAVATGREGVTNANHA